VDVHGIATWWAAGGAGAVGAGLALVLEYYDSLHRHGEPPSGRPRESAAGKTFVMGLRYYVLAVVCRVVIGVIVAIATVFAWIDGTSPLTSGQIVLAFLAGLVGPVAVAHLKGPASAAVLALLDQARSQLSRSYGSGTDGPDDGPADGTGGSNA
jgi:hypothetical protein